MNDEINQYREETINFSSINTNGFPTEGGGLINGAFKVKGYARIYQIPSKQWMVSIGAVAEIVNVTQGTVNIQGSATLFINAPDMVKKVCKGKASTCICPAIMI